MKENHYHQKRAEYSRTHDIYRLHVLEGMKVREIIEKLGVSRSCVYRALSTFADENPTEASLMKRNGQTVTQEENQKLLNEIADLKKELARERLRGDFYQEMVSYGKEVYGIDLKKAGTK